MRSENMDNCLRDTDLQVKSGEEYKAQIDMVILDILEKSETLVFANVVKKAGVTPYIINQYPELRSYILDKMKYEKEVYLMNKKIEKAATNLVKANKTVTFLSIVNRCKFNLDKVYHDELIKNKIRTVIAESMKN